VAVSRYISERGLYQPSAGHVEESSAFKQR
jgi:hypothetical protein